MAATAGTNGERRWYHHISRVHRDDGLPVVLERVIDWDNGGRLPSFRTTKRRDTLTGVFVQVECKQTTTRTYLCRICCWGEDTDEDGTADYDSRFYSKREQMVRHLCRMGDRAFWHVYGAREAAMCRMAADICAAMIATYTMTLFRLLRRRAFRRAIRNRVRAKLVLLRAPLFRSLPDVLLLNIGQQWL